MKRLLGYGLLLALHFTLACGGGAGQKDAGAGNQGADPGPTCGDGILDTSAGETCDTAIASGAGACPTTCPSADACNPSVLAHAGTCAAVCAAQPVACGSGDGCCPSGCTPANDGDCSQTPMADTTGTWFTYTSAKGTARTNPPAGSTGVPVTDDDVTINTWVRTYTSPQGDIRFEMCKLEVNGSLIRTSYSEEVTHTFQTTARAGGALQVPIGSAIALPTFTIYSGQDEEGNAVDAVPPPFPGGDGDGHPGVTVATQVYLLFRWWPFDAYSGLVITTSMSDVRVTSATTKTGRTAVTTRGVTFGSDNSTLAPAGTAFEVTFNGGSVPFTSTKVAADDSTTCAELLQRYP